MQHFAPPKVLIRDALPDDAATIAALGERFHAEAGWGDIAGYSAADCEKTLRQLIESADGICIVAVFQSRIVGMAGGLAYPLYFNHGHKTGQELFWWVEPGFRKGVGRELFDALEHAARARGCESWAMIALAKANPEGIGEIYRRRGYRASENSWVRRL